MILLNLKWESVLVNTDNFLIEEKDLELAQEICKTIQETGVRNRAIANAIAANIAPKFFESENADFESGLHNIANILNDIDIADIYVNNAYIDVRVFFNEEEFGVPKSHFDNNLTPAAYMFIKVTEDLSGATVVGFILPENIDTSKEISGFYPVEYDSLVSFYDIESHLIAEEDTYAVEDKDIFAYLDGTIADKNEFYRELIASKDGRLRLAKTAKAQYVFNFVSVAQPKAEATVEAAAEEEETTDLLEAPQEEDDFGSMEATPLDLMEEGASFTLEETLDEPVETEALLEESTDEVIGFADVEPANEIQPLEETCLLEESAEISLDFDRDDIVETVEEETVEEQETEEPQIQMADFDIDSIKFVTDAPEESFPSGFEQAAVEEPVLVEEPALEVEVEEDFSGLILEDSNSSEEIVEEISEPVVDIPKEEPEKVEVQVEEEEEDTSFEDFKTVTSPSLDVYEELENLDESEDTASATDEEPHEATEQTEEIEALFNNPEEQVEEIPSVKKSGSSLKLLLIAGFLAVLGAVGYFGYTKFTGAEDTQNNLVQEAEPIPAPDIPQETKVEEAMPVETVEAAKPVVNVNEGTAESIPAIEQNLDASILVSNLKVDWEVPGGYANNTSAKRYLVKLGKIVQLNLKTELLLLSKPPITNKIAVEIKYNPTSRKFETVGVTTSSGEQSVDDLILRTVQKALGMNLSTNSDSFTNLKGNPTLIIRL